ncbi:hypothetical protein SLI_5334 [Streptomyces lividans 1326]|uniref:Uncharacterized protein n=1 Tax=Streptomyces lividans 1326 TaxID=1200984 RepID=A0A7U9DVP1_STRLI|nr:hypothetical protein SLI_5334 [Streptomyces lividans 1326]
MSPRPSSPVHGPSARAARVSPWLWVLRPMAFQLAPACVPVSPRLSVLRSPAGP